MNKLCDKCKTRPAVVFIAATSSDGDTHEPMGYCMKCAKELGIKPISNLLERFGINSDEQMDQVNEQMTEMMNQLGIDNEDAVIPEEFLQDGGAINLMFGGNPMGDDDAPVSVGAVDDDSLNSFFGGMFAPNPSDDENDGDGKNQKKKKKKKNARKALRTYCTDLTQKAKEGRLDRIIGRDREIERVIQILSRRTKNNPCLIGEPGVGKTAIAEGLAMRIVQGDVPLGLADKEIHLLDLTGLVAGTQFRGQFESRIKGLIDEVKSEGNIILFIDEVHTLVGTGDSEGSMSAANIMKPALSRGEIQVIGATTFKEYRKHIEKDAALERRFQPVTIEEPSIEETVKILKGIKEYYEKYHRVSISDELIRKAVVLSERYITERFLPDKAIDLLDESCACAQLRNKAIAEYDQLTRKLKKCDEKLAELNDSDDDSMEFYEKQANIKIESSKIKKEMEELESEVIKAKVEECDLAKVIELWTGIPASKIEENENKRLVRLESELNSKVIGQQDAVSLVAAAIRRNRIQISPRRHPASFIFVGPTGVGKTELVKVLAHELFSTPDALIRVDMSEYMEKHSVSKIIGSPPGYIGHEESGQLTEKIRRKPYSVLLFDEIEKAHPDVMNILLQILDEGKITDAQGRVVNFENTVIIMTSNAGSERKEGLMGFDRSSNDINREKAMKSLSEFLRPEFLARVDEIVVFNELTVKDFKSIAVLMLNEYVDSLGERSIKLVYDDKAVEWLAVKAHGGKSAARDLRNLIRREVEDKLAEIMIENENVGGFSVTAGEKLEISVI